MKILSCVPCQYYNCPDTETYEYLSFVEVLRQMGHEVHAIDQKVQSQLNKLRFNEFFLSIVKNGGYDLVIIVTRKDEFIPEILDEAKKTTVILGWNCDDDWRWEDYSSKWIKHYSYMVTTYRHIYDENKPEHPNLLLNQWGCTGGCEGKETTKDINISFVGSCYNERFQQIDKLRSEFSLAAFGRGVRPRNSVKRIIQKVVARSVGISMVQEDLTLSNQNEVKKIWNRSKVSFTPLEASRGKHVQVKARVFDMGLSGSVLLCNKNTALYEFYEPSKEFVEFSSMEECVDKARYLLKNEGERQKISEAYYKRTKNMHLWGHRFKKLFSEIGLKNSKGI